MKDYLQQFEDWYKSLKIVKANNGPANGTIAAALTVLEKLKKNYNLNLSSHLAKGGVQIQGVSGTVVAEILKKYGEFRPFAKEGGRTNRGGPGEIKTLFETLSFLNLELLKNDKRNLILEGFQKLLITKVQDYHNRQRLKLPYHNSFSTRETVHKLLDEAKDAGKSGPVAQHLVGAKLQLRYPNLRITNESFSTADKPTGREGDFKIGNTIFHITVAPMQGVYEKCKQNIIDGFRVLLLVSDARLVAARQNAEDICGKGVAVESIETFVSQNIEELSVFTTKKLIENLVELINVYNRRVSSSEIDKSLLIDLPTSLK